jgi:hypothetical protein
MRRLLLASLVFLAGCDDPFFVEAKVAAVCQRLENQKFQVPTELREAFEQLPPEMRQGVSLAKTFDFDVSAQLPAEYRELMELKVQLTSVKLTVVNEGADFGFIEEGHLQLEPGAQSGLAARSFDYVRSETAPRSIGWQGDAFDVAAYLESGSLKYTVSLSGTLPPGDLVVNVEACAAATVRVDYL